MENDLISIIIPVYNVEKYLRQCLESVINQTYKNLEIILVDDGSKDASGGICDEYAEKDGRIKVIHKENGGVSSARNVGLENVTGSYIAFIDSDDYVLPCFIERLYNIVKKHNVDLVDCNYTTFEDNVIVKELGNDVEKIINKKEMQMRIYTVKGIRTIVLWNKLYKKELFNDLNFPDGKINEDEALIHRIIGNMKGQAAILDTELYYYRQNNTSIMGKKFNVNRMDIIDALEDRLQYYNEINEYELYCMTLARYQNRLKDYFIMVKENIEDADKYLRCILNKSRRNYFKYIKESKDKVGKKIKNTLFVILPNFYFWLIKLK